MTIFYVSIIVTLIVAIIILYQHGNDNLKCPKCGKNMTCYHYHYIDNNKDIDQYTYTCHNCDFRTIIKV